MRKACKASLPKPRLRAEGTAIMSSSSPRRPCGSSSRGVRKRFISPIISNPSIGGRAEECGIEM